MGKISDDMDFSDEFAILKEMEEDLREHYDREYEGEAKLGNSDAEEKRKFFFDSLVAETSLQEHLLDQLKLIETSVGQRKACEFIIGSLDENGFLSYPFLGSRTALQPSSGRICKVDWLCCKPLIRWVSHPLASKIAC